MRLKYICLCCGNHKSGVNKKICAQIEHFSRNGVDIQGYSLCEYKDFKTPHPLVSQVPISGIQGTSTPFQKLKRDHLLMEAIEEIIISSTAEDVIYLRHRFPFFKFLRILHKPRLCTIVLEFQTIEAIEARILGLYWYVILDKLYGKAIRAHTDAFVAVTDEITQYQISRVRDRSKPHITIGNGFDVASAPLRKAPAYDGEELHLLCVATVSVWHGLDRLLHGLASYKRTLHAPLHITLHIAGDGDQIPHIRRLTDGLGIRENVVFHGFLTGGPLDDLFDRCHVAVGSLGIHRIGLKEASILKAREYCARGIPFIYGIPDPDFPPDFHYVQPLPSDESPIDINKVRGFVEEVCADTDHPQKMRAYAEEYLDWSVKTKKLKVFLEALVSSQASKVR